MRKVMMMCVSQKNNFEVKPVMLERKKEDFTSTDKPFMVCSNAMNKSHKCVYCKCYGYYAKELRTEESDNNDIINKRRKGNNNEIHLR